MKRNYLMALAIGILPSLLFAQDPSRGDYRIDVKKLDILNYTPLAQISVAPDGTWVAIDPQGNVYNGTQYAWQKMPGNLNQVSAGSRDEIWGVNFDHAVFRFNNSTNNWDTIAGPGSLQQVVVARRGGLVMGIQWAAPKKLVRWDATTRQWIALDGAPPIVELAIGSPKHVLGITATGELYKLMLPSWTNWKKLQGNFKHISLGEDGTLGVVGTDGVIRRRTNEDIEKEVTAPNTPPTYETPNAPASTIEVVNKDQSHIIDSTGTTAELLPISVPVVIQPVEITIPALNKTITIDKPSIPNTNLVLIGQKVVKSGEEKPPFAELSELNCETFTDAVLNKVKNGGLSFGDHCCVNNATGQAFVLPASDACPVDAQPWDCSTMSPAEMKCYKPIEKKGRFSKVTYNKCTPSSTPPIFNAMLDITKTGGCMGRSPKVVVTREPPQATVVAGYDCAPRSFLNRSAHSSVQWELPSAKAGSAMTVKAGAHSNYIVPACHRVWWSDLYFACLPSGNASIPYQWKLLTGQYNADGLCHGTPGKNFYQSISDKGTAD